MNYRNPDNPHYTIPVKEINRSDCDDLIKMAIREDAPLGDPTSESIFSLEQIGRAAIVSRVKGVLCGTKLVQFICDIDREINGSNLQLEWKFTDGDAFAANDALVIITGQLVNLLRLERIILNFLQYLSGISTVTAEAVRVAGSNIAILDTRKTLPGYRRLSKYAVYCGGGTNHRIHLSDMAMIKDNHIVASGSITNAVQRIRKHHPDLPLDVEVDTLAQLEQLLPLEPRVVLLDNMNREQIETALSMIRSYGDQHGREQTPFVEVSGGWTPERLAELSGLDGIGVSMGFLTHTTHFLDLSMEIEIPESE